MTLQNPSWWEDPPEDDIDADAAEQFAEEQFDDIDNDWDTPDHAPYNDPDYQAELDRRQERAERMQQTMVNNLNRRASK